MTEGGVVEWVSVRRAGDLLSVSPQTVWRLIEEGRLVKSTMETETAKVRALVSLASVDAERVRREMRAA